MSRQRNSAPPRRLSRTALAVVSLAALAGCSDYKRTLGFTRDAPDEFTVTTRAPLAMPSSYELTPPQPGMPRPQETSQTQQAEEVLVPATALAGDASAKGQDSRGQSALVAQAGPPAPPRIRQMVNAEAVEDRPAVSITDRLMFWRDRQTPGTVVDAPREAQRIRENAALGQPVIDGDTPIVQPKRKSILGAIDPF